MADINAPAAAPIAESAAPTEIAPLGSNHPAQAAAQDAKEVIADPNASKAQKTQALKRLKSLKIKVDGQEFDEALPFEMDDTKENRDWMTRQLQMSKVAQKRMGEKTQLENEVRQFIDEARKNPRKLAELGVDLKKLSAEMIEEEIANSQKSPEQLAQEKLQKELSDLKKKYEDEQKSAQSREFERLQEQEYERYENLMTTTLQSSDLPKSPYVVKKMSQYMMMGLQEGYDVTPEDVLPLVREEILEDIRQMAQAMPIETIEKLFGGDILGKIRKKNIAKAKSAPTVGAKKVNDVGATPAQKAAPATAKKLNYRQFFGV